MLTKLLRFGTLGLLMTWLVSSPAFSRAPAVLPVTELSIEEYKTVLPADAKSTGHDFSTNGTATVLIPIQGQVTVVTDQATAEAKLMNKAIEHQAMLNLRSLSVYLILFMMSLPALAWLYMSRKPETIQFPQASEATTTGTDAVSFNNVTVLAKKNSKSGKEAEITKKAS